MTERALASDLRFFRAGKSADHVVFEWEVNRTTLNAGEADLASKFWLEIDVDGDTPDGGAANGRYDSIIEWSTVVDHKSTTWTEAGTDGGDGKVKVFNDEDDDVGGDFVDAPALLSPIPATVGNETTEKDDPSGPSNGTGYSSVGDCPDDCTGYEEPASLDSGIWVRVFVRRARAQVS